MSKHDEQLVQDYWQGKAIKKRGYVILVHILYC